MAIYLSDFFRMVGIVVLLSISGPLIISMAYREHRILGALAAAVWLLIALFFAGLNLRAGLELAVAYPLRAVAAFGGLFVAFFYLGPKSALWNWAAGLWIFRVPVERLRRYLGQRDVSWRAGREMVGMAAALILLAPVAYVTVQPDPLYGVVKKGFQPWLSRELPDVAKLEAAEAAAVLDRFTIAIGDRVAKMTAAVEQRANGRASSIRGRIRAQSPSPELARGANGEVDSIVAGIRSGLEIKLKQTWDSAIRERSRVILDAERLRFFGVANAAILHSRDAEVIKSLKDLDRAPVARLWRIAVDLVSDAREAMSAAARSAIGAEMEQVLDAQRGEIEKSADAALQRTALYHGNDIEFYLDQVVIRLAAKIAEEKAWREPPDRRK